MKFFITTLILLTDSIIVNSQNSTNNFTLQHAYDSIQTLIEKMNNIESIETIPRSIQKGPTSLSILMNFGFDGTSSLHLMSGLNSIFWSDSGHCLHGQMYDPLTGCRDIFCVEGYVLGPNGCTQDLNYKNNISVQLDSSHKISPEMHIELTIKHKQCILIENYNDTINCTEPSLLDQDDFIELFQHAIANILSINPKRIENIEIVLHEIKKKELLDELVLKMNSSYLDETEFNNKYEFELGVNCQKKIYRIVELIRVSFTLLDKKLFDDKERDTIQLYFTLIMFGLEKYLINLNEHLITITNIIEIKKSDYIGWCGDRYDIKEYILNNNFRIMVSFDQVKRYFVYLNTTRKYYNTGDFYLTILYKANNYIYTKSEEHTFESIHDHNNHIINNHLIDYSMINFTDITDLILKTNDSGLETSTFLTVCNRGPKIRVNCDGFATIKVSICEFNYISENRSYCWSRFNNKCYSINEYEYDLIQSDKYIRICQYFFDSKTVKSNQSLDLFVLIPAWLSLAANIISLILMILTLITYFLFRELRNIPGWIIINLTLALSIAQTAFLLGSFLNENSRLCFLISLITHYGYLASFFWMNVSAFDLYRNFRDKSSHILIQSLKLKDRMPKYALYAWLTPSLIVLIGLIIDLTVLEPIFLVPFRPCYAGYLKGCDFIKNDLILNTSDFCDDLRKIKHFIIITKSCWIQNGKANLIFFGIPIGIIILINGVYYFITVYNIRKKKRRQAENQLRRFSRVKLPGDEEIKFYIQMAIIMGFTWISGFLMTDTDNSEHYLFNTLVLYLFIVANGFTGSFIFFAFICRAEIKTLYMKMFGMKSRIKTDNKFSSLNRKISTAIEAQKPQIPVIRIDENSLSNLSTNLSFISSNTSLN